MLQLDQRVVPDVRAAARRSTNARPAISSSTLARSGTEVSR